MNKTQNLVSLLGGALAGAAAMYLLDPETGKRRREYLAEQAGEYLDDAGEKIQSGWQNVSERAGDLGEAVAEKARDYGQHLSDWTDEYRNRAARYGNRASRKAQKTGSSWADTAKDWASSASAKAGRLFNRYGDQARDYASDYASSTGDAAGDITDYGNHLWDQVRHLGRRVSGSARSAAKQARKKASEHVEGHSAAVPIVATGVGCAALGLGLMYLMDPRLGRTRRVWLSNKTTSVFRRTGRTFYGVGRDVANRSYGMVAEARGKFQTGEPVGGELLLQRVRSEMGRVCSHPKLVEVMADSNGTITVSGLVLAEESQNLISTIESVPGVKLVINRLEVENNEQDLNRHASREQSVPRM